MLQRQRREIQWNIRTYKNILQFDKYSHERIITWQHCFRQQIGYYVPYVEIRYEKYKYDDEEKKFNCM